MLPSPQLLELPTQMRTTPIASRMRTLSRYLSTVADTSVANLSEEVEMFLAHPANRALPSESISRVNAKTGSPS